MDPLDLTLVDEPVLRVLAAWPHSRIEAVGAPGSRAAIRRVLCGWRYNHDRLARLSGVTEIELQRALDVIDAAGLIDATTGDVDEVARALMRKSLAARLRR